MATSLQNRIARRMIGGLMCLGLLLPATGCGNKPAETTTAPSPAPSTTAASATTTAPAAQTRSKLTGLPVDADVVDRRVLAVTFDNHPDARPQAGLSQADVVFEIRVEGTYTRYMGLYQSQSPDRVGPIRSARDCFLDRTTEYNASYAHFGGSYTALERIEREMRSDLNGMTMGGDAMWRDDSTGKEAPHNVYADTNKLRDVMKEKNDDFKVEISGFNFHEQPTDLTGAEPAKTVTLTYASDNQTRYTYDAATQRYLRFKDGETDVDENTKEQLSATNIIIQKCDSYLNLPPLRKVEQVGSGDGYYVTRGGIIPIHWEKPDEMGLTLYTTTDGQPLALNPGQTWVQVVDLDSPIETSAE